MVHVSGDAHCIERCQLAADRDPLIQLAQRPELELEAELRLPSLLPRLECIAEFVGERSERLRRRNSLAFAVLAQ